MRYLIRVFATVGLLVIPVAACQLFGGKSSESSPPPGAVDRRYNKSSDDIARAAPEALREIDISVESNEHDALGGQLKAVRNTPEKEPITITYKSLDPGHADVSVLVGDGDRTAATLIQERIAQHLGAASARAVPEAGASTEARYAPPVSQCLTAAEQALKDLRMKVTRREIHDTWAELESREADALPVSIRMERTEKDKTHIIFRAGTSRCQDTQQVADRLKIQFEKNLGQPELPPTESK